nr:hypothetical protein [Oleisolibacter albus]
MRQVFPLSVCGGIGGSDPNRTIIRRMAAYGHFGRENEGFQWERTNRVDARRALCTGSPRGPRAAMPVGDSAWVSLCVSRI